MSDEFDPMPSTRRPKQSPTTIGNHRLKPATLMMGYGFDPSLSEGSLKAPIFLTSTFVFETAAQGKRFFEGITGKSDGSGGFTSEDQLTDGSLLPSISVDQYAATLGGWMGLSSAELKEILPHLSNFNADEWDLGFMKA